MNKFVKLYEEARKYAYEKLEPEYYNTPIFESIVVGRFGELVVMECADIADINAHQHECPGSYVLQHFDIDKSNIT